MHRLNHECIVIQPLINSVMPCKFQAYIIFLSIDSVEGEGTRNQGAR